MGGHAVGDDAVDGQAVGEPTPAGPSPEPTQPPTIDRDALLTQLRVGGRTRPALVAKVIGLFLADTPAILDDLDQGLAQQDQRSVTRAVHTIKSSANSVGAYALSALAGEAEGHARANALAVVQANVAEIHRQYNAAVVQLVTLRAELLQPQTETLDT